MRYRSHLCAKVLARSQEGTCVTRRDAPVVSYLITELFCRAKIIGVDAHRALGRVQTGPLRLQMVEVVGRVFSESLA